ncbi:phosphate acyltransferase PlsX [candidate division WOR-3 bacterium]|nr:phosphate acyltransferase PlsX [candidate division WOR-3 bacterium]
MKIAVDVMGGDYAPRKIIEGVNLAYEELGNLIEIQLVGNKEIIKKFPISDKFSIVDTSQVVSAGEPPLEAFRKKKNSSLAKAVELQKIGKADVTISAGNTGAAVAFSILSLGRLEGVDRPALATFFPTKKDKVLVLDVGANSGVKPLNLRDFGVMGSLYLEKIFNFNNPTVGLLSMGKEDTKGGKSVKEAHDLLSEANINFIGNVEGYDILNGNANVVVCDGFTGNAVLKFGESMVDFILSEIKEGATKNLIAAVGGLFMKPIFKGLMKRVNYEEYGGAILLGINGITVICHGKSNERAIKNAIIKGYKFYDLKVNSLIQENLTT